MTRMFYGQLGNHEQHDQICKTGSTQNKIYNPVLLEGCFSVYVNIKQISVLSGGILYTNRNLYKKDYFRCFEEIYLIKRGFSVLLEG